MVKKQTKKLCQDNYGGLEENTASASEQDEAVAEAGKPGRAMAIMDEWASGNH